MKRNSRVHLHLGISAFLFSISVVGAALADSYLAGSTNLDQTIQGAESIVHGRIESKRSEYLHRPDGSRTIITRYSLAVDETLKGSGPANHELVVDGGTVDGITLKVSDMPPLDVGEEIVVLGDQTAEGFRLHRRRDGLIRLQRSAAQNIGQPTTLDDVRQRIQALGRK